MPVLILAVEKCHLVPESSPKELQLEWSNVTSVVNFSDHVLTFGSIAVLLNPVAIYRIMLHKDTIDRMHRMGFHSQKHPMNVYVGFYHHSSYGHRFAIVWDNANTVD